jgi:hypothetical protein
MQWGVKTVSGFVPARGAYDPDNDSPIYEFSFTPIFTGGGHAIIGVDGEDESGSPVDVSEMIFFAADYTEGIDSGTAIVGHIDISAGENPGRRIFKFHMIVDGVVAKPPIYINIGWA